jgi:nicotinamidase-related amidase
MDTMIVVDMQVGLLNGAPKYDLQGVVDRINQLTAIVRSQSGKVVWIQHCGRTGDGFEPSKPGWSFLPEMDRQRADVVVQKTLNDPFVRTDLQATLKKLVPDSSSGRMGHRLLRRRDCQISGFEQSKCRCRQ